MTTTRDARAQPIALPDDVSALEQCYERGWTDGLPVIPPAVERVDAMLAAAGADPEAIVAEHPTTGRRCSAHSAAANAVMAGCRDDYFPVVLAALRAMSKEPFNYHASTASTGGAAHAVVVSGPIAEAIGMNAGVNAFGSGNRANATIGRAIRLIHRNVFKMLPGTTDRSTQGNPGKYSLCVAENAAASPWPALNLEFGLPADQSIVVTFAAGGFANVENHMASTPEEVLLTVADSMSALGSLTGGQSVVVLSPEHAKIVAADGSWDRARVRAFLYENARRSSADLERVGRAGNDDGSDFHRGHGPDDIVLLVAGADAGGHSAFLSSWSRGRASIFQVEPVT